MPPWQIVQNTDDSSVVKAFGAIEIALWDIRQALRIPLHALLAGAVRKQISFTEYFGFRAGGEMSPQDVTDYCLRMREEHGSTFFEGKLMPWRPRDRDRDGPAPARRTRASAMIRLDSNMQWSLATARHVLREIEPCNIRNFEDPVATFEEMALFATQRHPLLDPCSGHKRAVALGCRTRSSPFRSAGRPSREPYASSAPAKPMGVGFWCYSGDTGLQPPPICT